MKVILLAFMAIVLMLPCCAAQDYYNRAQASSGFTLSPGGVTQINADVFEAHYVNEGVVVSTWGNLQVISSSLYVNCKAATSAFAWIVVAGHSPIPHVTLRSVGFLYTDYTTFTTVPAHLVVTMTGYGAIGQGSFKLTRDSDGAVVASSTVRGIYQEVPFTGGFLQITQ